MERAWRHPALASPGSESNVLAADRGVRALRRVLAEQEGRGVVVSTHGNLLALILNRFDPCYGLGTWRSLTFPDVCALTFRGNRPPSIQRVWKE